MRLLFLSITFVGVLAAANTISELNKEFSRRDSLKLTNQQGAVINYLRAIKFPLTSIKELETLEDGEQSFIFKDQNDIVCFGQILQQNLRCKTKLNLTSQEFNAENMDISLLKTLSSDLAQEFVKRNDAPVDTHTQVILAFLTKVKYPVDTIVELELMKDLSASFFVRDRNDIVCFGSAINEMLRCKNDIGITGVTFTGDSD